MNKEIAVQILERVHEIMKSPKTIREFLEEKLTDREMDEFYTIRDLAGIIVEVDFAIRFTYYFVMASVIEQFKKWKIPFIRKLTASLLQTIAEQPIPEYMKYIV